MLFTAVAGCAVVAIPINSWGDPLHGTASPAAPSAADPAPPDPAPTPAPVTPVPVTPAPVTPAPVTPATVTPDQASPPPASTQAPSPGPQRPDPEKPISKGGVPAATSPGPAVPEVAKPAPRTLSFLYRLNLEFGGDDIATIMLTDGNTNTLTAGGLAAWSGGLFYHPDAPFTLEATLGYKSQKLSYDNGSIGFTRYPVDVIASLRAGGFRIGLGGTAHFSPTISCSIGGVCGGEVSLDTAYGGIVQSAYSFQRGTVAFDLGVRLTRIKYSNSEIHNLDGSCVGLFLGGWL